jgi:hypothetical protein
MLTEEECLISYTFLIKLDFLNTDDDNFHSEILNIM